MTYHEQLQREVERAQDQLETAWSLRRSDEDILVLCDPKDANGAKLVATQYDEKSLAILKEHAYSRGRRLFVPCLQPPQIIDAMWSMGGPTRETAEELRGFQDVRKLTGYVPLLFLVDGGHWATIWSPPGNKGQVVRYEPATAVDRN